MVMTAHVVLPEIDPERPVTLSASGVTYLREKLGLSGLLLTDDISMGALSGKVEARAESAHEAGCDLVLHCNGDLSEMSAIASAVGGMSSSARRLADIAFSGRRDPLDVDICDFEAEFAALTQEAGKMPDGDAEFVEIEARVEPDALFVDVDGFEGPLDLLLQLARNQKVDLRKISVLAPGRAVPPVHRTRKVPQDRTCGRLSGSCSLADLPEVAIALAPRSR